MRAVQSGGRHLLAIAVGAGLVAGVYYLAFVAPTWWCRLLAVGPGLEVATTVVLVAVAAFGLRHVVQAALRLCGLA